MREGRPPKDALDALPDVRDGLTRLERIVLFELHRLERELGVGQVGRKQRVPTAMLYGRVVEHIDVREDELVRLLARLGARESST